MFIEPSKHHHRMWHRLITCKKTTFALTTSPNIKPDGWRFSWPVGAQIMRKLSFPLSVLVDRALMQKEIALSPRTPNRTIFCSCGSFNYSSWFMDETRTSIKAAWNADKSSRLDWITQILIFFLHSISIHIVSISPSYLVFMPLLGCLPF